jgi:putative oxidoreductase
MAALAGDRTNTSCREGKMLKRLMGTGNDVALTSLRVVLGMVFFAHGAQKMLGWFGGVGLHATIGWFTQMGMPAPMALLIMCTEFFGGLGLIVGLLTRIASLGVAGLMIGAIFMVHLPNGFFMNWMGTQKGEGIEFHLLALAMAAALLLRGAGAFSLDRALAK